LIFICISLPDWNLIISKQQPVHYERTDLSLKFLQNYKQTHPVNN
jgi:hypothetical protein